MFVEQLLPEARAALVTVAGDASLVEAAKLLQSGTDLLVVGDGSGRLAGILTKTDIVAQVGRRAGFEVAATSAMTADVVVCRPEDELAAIAALMKSRGLKNIPVIGADERPIGVLTQRAILRVLLSGAEQEEALLSDYVKGVGYR